MFCLIAFLLSIIKKNSKKIIICTNFFCFGSDQQTFPDPHPDNSEISDPDPIGSRREC